MEVFRGGLGVLVGNGDKQEGDAGTPKAGTCQRVPWQHGLEGRLKIKAVVW